ncbi:hypothetical protein [Streptomyces hirsutus]|uniref:hypothetical protein n=1 Tax=Streptomyces hirsutus TaxID=35620 RepID=UPI0033AB52AE
MTVCDNRADGMRATAIFIYTGANSSERVRISDTNGSGNSCATQDFSIPEGNRVLLEVCVQNGANGTAPAARKAGPDPVTGPVG